MRPQSSVLEQRIEHLKKSLAQDPTLDVSLGALYSVDLTDEAQVRRRVGEIDARLLDLGHVPTSSTATRTPALFALLLERQFLNQPRAIRVALVAAEQGRLQRLAEKQAAAEAIRQAEAQAKAAEEERLRALAEAQVARTAAIQSLNNKRAAVLEVRRKLAARDEALAKGQKIRARADARWSKQIEDVLLRAASADTSSAAIAGFYAVDRMLSSTLDHISDVREEASADLDLPKVSVSPAALSTTASPEEKEAAAELNKTIVEYSAYRDQVEAREDTLRSAAIANWHKTLSRIIDAREAALKSLPRSERDRVFSFEFALAEAQLETRAVTAWLRGWLAVRTDEFTHLSRTFERLLNLRTLFALLKIAAVLLIAVWAARRGKALRQWWRTQDRGGPRTLASIRRHARIERTVDILGPPILFVATVHVVDLLVGSSIPELDLLTTVILWLAYYRLVRRAIEGGIVGLARRRRLKIDRGLQRKIERSTMLAGRTLFIGGLFRSLVVRVVGAGVIFHYVEILIVVFLGGVALVLLRRWRTDIAERYLILYPEGTLARLVSAAQNQWYGFFVVSAAFSYVAVRAAVGFGKDVALGFDQIRKALAFIFRLRLERRAEELGEWEGSIEQLPKSLRKAFTQHALHDPTLRIDHFPGMDKLERDLEQWKDNKAKGSFLLVGERGMGKTTWLHRAVDESGDIPTTFVTLEREIQTSDDLAKHLAEALAIEDEAPTLGRIGRELNKSERRIMILDDLHHIYSRTIGGALLLDELMGLIERTGARVFWLVAVNELMWRYVENVRKRNVPFRAEVKLGGWSEEHISMLLMARAAASSVIHEFEDLVVDAEKVTSDDALARTSQAYTRLIWDYSDGSPLVAIHYWLRSLVPMDGTRVKVRLFKAPDLERLARMPEEAVFLYASIALHGNLSTPEAAKILRYPAAVRHRPAHPRTRGRVPVSTQQRTLRAECAVVPGGAGVPPQKARAVRSHGERCRPSREAHPVRRDRRCADDPGRHLGARTVDQRRHEPPRQRVCLPSPPLPAGLRLRPLRRLRRRHLPRVPVDVLGVEGGAHAHRRHRRGVPRPRPQGPGRIARRRHHDPGGEAVSGRRPRHVRRLLRRDPQHRTSLGHADHAGRQRGHDSEQQVPHRPRRIRELGELTMLVQQDFYVGVDQDIARAKGIVEEALTSSCFFYPDLPWTVLVNQVQLENMIAVRLRAKAYVLELRYEKAFESDVSQRILEAFQDANLLPPAVLHRDSHCDSVPSTT